MVSKTRVHRKAFSESGDRARASRSGSALCASDGLDQPRPPPLWIRDQHNAQENSSVVTTEWRSSPLSEEELIELPECVCEFPVRRAHCGASCDFPTLSRHRAQETSNSEG